MHALGSNACQLACLARRSLFAASSNAQAWSAHSGMSSLQGASQPGSAGLSASATATSGTTVPTYPAPDASRMGTADLCDVHYPDPVDKTVQPKVQIMQAGLFRDFGGSKRFSGQVTTVKCYENNPLVRKALEESGRGRVLVVDGGGSMRCALLGDMLADMGAKNGWSGIIVHGCIRDSEDIGRMPLGVKALATHPLKSAKRDPGLRDVPVTIGGVPVRPGDWVYADMDGVLVSPEKLSL